MANIKTITKKLVNAGFSENKLILMTEKEIRETYKALKEESNMKNNTNEVETINSETTVEVEKEETTMKKNNNTTATNNSINNKEVITMTNEMIKEMKKLARNYDAFTHCIEDCRQREEAEKRNKVLDTKFVEIANKMGINATANDLYEIISNDYDSFDKAIEAYIKSHDVRVISATLTQENGELTFVELSPEQKLEISKVLDTQLQDVNYSSWFEEENGIFKLYTAWVDEDPTVEEEYYFDDNNKLIKVEVEKEETTMRTTQELINDALNIKKIQDKKYVTNEMLRAEYQKLTGEAIGARKTRMVIITKLQEHINQNTKEELNTSIVFDDGLALKILERVIRQADTNKAHNFISDWMLTSIISELVLGYPLKDKGHEYYKSFTAEQKKILVDIRKAFINKTHLIAKTNNGKITGYYIPAKVLVWGRHVYLGVACIYRFMSGNKIVAEYHVSLNGIKNIDSGVITELDNNAYATLDSKCVFVM